MRLSVTDQQKVNNESMIYIHYQTKRSRGFMIVKLQFLVNRIARFRRLFKDCKIVYLNELSTGRSYPVDTIDDVIKLVQDGQL